MDDSLKINPPDNAVFEKKVSSKQKEHLARAREKAKETIERRRKLDVEANVKLGIKDEDKESPLPERPEPDDEPEPPKPKREPKKKTETPEDKELRKFESFMKNMNLYEEVKMKHAEQVEEAKKIKCSFTQDEYNYLMGRLEEDDKRNEANLAKANPASKPRAEAPIRRTMNTRTKVSKFGR